MKNSYFLVVVFAVVCTAWNVAESQDCSESEMKECFIILIGLTDNEVTDANFIKEELERRCGLLNRAFECVNNYAERCMEEEKRLQFQSRISGVVQAVKKQCQPGPFQEEALTHAACLSEIRGDLEVCRSPNKQKISLEDDSDIQAACCKLRDVNHCMHGIVVKKCGQQAATYVDDVFNQISSPIMQDRCKSYDQCPGSSAKRNSPRALLFPVSIALTLLYALLST